MGKFWTTEEDGYISAYYGFIPIKNIELTLNRPQNTIKIRAGKLGVQKQGQNKYWQKWEEDYLKESFPRCQKEIIVAKLNRTWMAIRNKAKKLGIKRESRMKFVVGVNHYFFDTWSKEMAYVLGFISTKGRVHKNGYRFSLSINKCYESTIARIRDLIAPKIQIRYRTVINGEKKTECSSLEICSKYMCSSLAKHGILANKISTMRFPKVPEEFIADFVRGAFDGVGRLGYNSESKYWRMSFGGTEEF